MIQERENLLTQIENQLDQDQLEQVDAWGKASSDMCFVVRPTTNAGISQTFQLAHNSNHTVGFRGAGNSYGDAALNGESILLDLSRMKRILDWQPETGTITVEPGVTLEQLWHYVIEDGWWLPVATGTAKTSVGGCAAMNVHGKNAWQLGPFGEHITTFDLMLPSGEILTCNRDQNSDIFHTAIGGFGMLGCFTAITLKLKRIYSGLLRIKAKVARNTGEMLHLVDDYAQKADYIVGWGDAFATGKSLGRGQIHAGNYLSSDDDPHPRQTLRIQNQIPPEFFFGIMPANIIWLFMRPFWNNFGMRWVNFAKYWASWQGDGAVIYQPHASFHFLLDYVPNWKKAYGKGGLIQYQPFIPADKAEQVFNDLLRLGHEKGLPNYLTVIKRHRPDPFLMTHAVDGFSMAMDYRITPRNRDRVVALCRQMDEIVLNAGGRFYFAKDSTLRPEIAQAYLGTDTIAKFRTLKQRCDPQNILETNLWRRVFPQ